MELRKHHFARADRVRPRFKATSIALDHCKVKAAARFDCKWVLPTDLDLPAAEVALGDNDLWLVESLFRCPKSINAGRSFVIRSALRGAAGKAIQAAGVALGLVVRLLDSPATLPVEKSEHAWGVVPTPALRAARHDHDREGRCEKHLSKTGQTAVVGA